MPPPECNGHVRQQRRGGGLGTPGVAAPFSAVGRTREAREARAACMVMHLQRRGSEHAKALEPAARVEDISESADSCKRGAVGNHAQVVCK